MLRKETDTIELNLPFPFTRTIAVNYAELHPDYIVILTGPRSTVLQSCKLLTINGRWYMAWPFEFQKALSLMMAKYGAEHVDHYFTNGDAAAYRISPYSGNVNLAETVRMTYDKISSTYLDEVGSSRLQMELRKKTSGFLSSFLAHGMSVLEIGCSNAVEFKDALKPGLDIQYHCVDVSPAALRKACSLSGIPESSFALWDYGIFKVEGMYDLIFSTFGALDTMTVKDIRAVLERNLKPGGILVGTILNRISVMDVIMSAITGKWVYARDRIHGNMYPGYSRYPMHVFCRNPERFLMDLGLEIMDFRGISLISAPYNYGRVNSILSRFPGLFGIDELLSRNRFLARFCEYTCFAGRYFGDHLS